jgi:hypothetical protein
MRLLDKDFTYSNDILSLLQRACPEPAEGEIREGFIH